jgi:A1 cistron-splicing factor AAR2
LDAVSHFRFAIFSMCGDVFTTMKFTIRFNLLVHPNNKMKIEDITDQEVNLLGMVLCIGTPSHTEFGVDYYAYTVSDEFVGMKNIPFGTHLVFYSFGNSINSMQNSPRICLFVTLTAECPYIVLKYNSEEEDYDIVDTTSNEAKQMINQYIYDYSHKLGDYPMDKSYPVWNKLANYITPELVSRLEPIKKKIFSTLSLEEDKLLKEQEQQFKQSRNDTTVEQEDHSYRVFYTHIPRKLTQMGVSGNDLTTLNFDKTALLRQLLKTKYENNYNYLLAELQFAFVCFLIGQALDALEQWKKLIELLCNCDAASRDPQLIPLINNFIIVLINQLEVSPSDFFIDELSGNNYLSKQLTALFAIVGENPHLNQSINLLRRLLVERFNVDLEQDLDDFDDAPVIVSADDLIFAENDF